MNSQADACNLEVLLAIVERFTSIGEAEAAVSALEAGGVEATLFDDVVVGLDWMYSNAVGGIKLVIREEDYDAAADILDLQAEEAQQTAEDEESPEPVPEETLRCPACGLETIATLPKVRIFVCLAVLIGAVGIAVKQLEIGRAHV